ncbi:MAG: GNAT family N-acetyltransferase [Acidimicrobiaceae bacterium]|nr:GNAT family N-acetyltransferase [Acidimicrobiaceae bacterium]
MIIATTDRLIIRPFVLSDIEGFHRYRSLPSVNRYLYSEALDLEACGVVVNRKITESSITTTSPVLSLAVIEAATEVLIGDVFLGWPRVEHSQAEIGYVFDPSSTGQGLATEAVRWLVGFAFDEVGAHRVFGRCDGRNEASVALMRRVGLRVEAHLLQNEFVKGEWTDEVVCAILDLEWYGVDSKCRHRSVDWLGRVDLSNP